MDRPEVDDILEEMASEWHAAMYEAADSVDDDAFDRCIEVLGQLTPDEYLEIRDWASSKSLGPSFAPLERNLHRRVVWISKLFANIHTDTGQRRDCPQTLLEIFSDDGQLSLELAGELSSSDTKSARWDSITCVVSQKKIPYLNNIDLPEGFEFVQPESVDTVHDLVRSHSLIVADFSHRISAHGKPVWQEKPRKCWEDNEQVIYEVCTNLGDEAIAVARLPTRFLRKAEEGVISALELQGVFVQFIVEQDSVQSLVSFCPIPREQVCVGKLAEAFEENDFKEFLTALFNGSSSRWTRTVDLQSFRNFTETCFNEKIKRLASQNRLVPYETKQVILQVHKGSEPNQAASDGMVWLVNDNGYRNEGGLYVDSPPEEADFELLVNREILSPEYFALFHESDFGKKQLEVISDFCKQQIGDNCGVDASILYLPKLPDNALEKESFELQRKIAEVQSGVEAIADRARQSPVDAAKLLDQCKEINRSAEMLFREWVESLPFPIASVLWTACAMRPGADSMRAKLVFFESLAAFHAVVLLSAFHQDEKRWPGVQEKIGEALKSAGLTLERPSFGVWKIISDVLAKRVRELLEGQDSDKEEAKQLLKTDRIETCWLFANTKVAEVIGKANGIRNQIGHGGVLSSRSVEHYQQQVDSLLATLRSCYGMGWTRFRLVDPISSKFARGEHHTQCRIICGSHIPFEEKELITKKPLEDGCLHLVSSGFDESLPLLPLVQMMHSSDSLANSCFFLHDIDGDSVCMHSFNEHEAAKPINNAQGLAGLIRGLF